MLPFVLCLPVFPFTFHIEAPCLPFCPLFTCLPIEASVYLFTHLLFILRPLASMLPFVLCLPVYPFTFHIDAHASMLLSSVYLFTYLPFLLMPLATMLPSTLDNPSTLQQF